MISQGSKKGLYNPWVLGVIGLIAVVLAVNGAFIWLAMQNRPALVDHEYNTRSRKSDAAVLSDLEAHRALAWKIAVRLPEPVVMNSPVAYEIHVRDRADLPVSGTMEVMAYRASDAGRDFAATFREASPGNYQGHISFPLKGYWELRIHIKRGDDAFMVSTGRFMVAAAP